MNNPVLFVQNGIGHMELVKNTEFPHVAFATVEHGARRIDDRTVSHNGIGMMTIATARGDRQCIRFNRTGTFGHISCKSSFGCGTDSDAKSADQLHDQSIDSHS